MVIFTIPVHAGRAVTAASSTVTDISSTKIGVIDCNNTVINCSSSVIVSHGTVNVSDSATMELKSVKISEKYETFHGGDNCKSEINSSFKTIFRRVAARSTEIAKQTVTSKKNIAAKPIKTVRRNSTARHLITTTRYPVIAKYLLQVLCILQYTQMSIAVHPTLSSSVTLSGCKYCYFIN